MIITISGDIGSGKSTAGRRLVKTLDYEYLSTGGIQRKIAEEMGITTLELNILSERDTAIDDKIDSYTKALNQQEESYIVDSRLAWHFIPSSFKVYLQCDMKEAARRISNDDTRSGEKMGEKVETLLNKIIDRRASEKRRFIHKYGVDYTLLSHYDLIVDSTNRSPQKVEEEVLKHFKTWQSY